MKIKSWEDVDAALALITESQKVIAEARAKVDHEKAIIAAIEPRIEAFVREHEDELQERSKSLPHGRVWLRSATRLVARSWAKVLERIRECGRPDLVRAKEEPDKEKLAEMADETLKRFGVRRETEDVFGYEAS